MTSRSFWLGIVLAAAVTACGGDDKSSSSSSSGGSSSGTASSSGGSSSGDTTSGGTDGGGTVTPKAAGPKMTSIMKMAGALHVNWENPAECDSVEVERQDGADAEFKVVFKLAADIDNKHDMGATKDMVYTYRARCKVGADYTEYSNTMSENPI